MSESDTLKEIAREDGELFEEIAQDEGVDSDVRELAKAILKRGGSR